MPLRDRMPRLPIRALKRGNKLFTCVSASPYFSLMLQRQAADKPRIQLERLVYDRR